MARTVRRASWIPILAGLAALLWPLGAAAPVQAATPAPSLARSEVQRVLSAAQEFSAGQATGEHLRIAGTIVTVPDGRGGTLTAVPTVRWPTADGYGQLVLFWHNGRLIGSDRLAKLPNLGEESSQLKIVASGTGYVTVRFWRYAPQDPMYAPSRGTADVTYRWTSAGLTASSAVPADSGNKLAMRLGNLSLTRTEVLKVTQAAVETASDGPTGEHLQPFGKVVTVPDGFGGTLTAVPVVRWPTADAYGQMVLFWHDQTFLGSMQLAKLPSLGEEVNQLKIVATGTGSITVRFWRYAPQDPMYAPSLPTRDITYTWTGHGLQASGTVPADSGDKLTMAIGK